MFSSSDVVPFLLTAQEKTKLVTFLNPVSFYSFRRLECRFDFDYVFSDGIFLTLLHNIFFSDKKINRVSFDFSSIANDVLSFGQENNKTIIFVGGDVDDAKKAETFFNSRYSLNNCFCFSGFFKDEIEMTMFVKSLQKFNPDYIVCGMGHPHQEIFLSCCKKNLINHFIGFTCGGFISQTALRSDYYSPWIKRFGLRWLQRAYLHKHVRDRLLKDYPIFFFRYLFDAVFRRASLYK